MTTAALSAFGVTLTRDSNLIAEITNLGSPETTLETIDVTNHDSPGSFREKIGGLLDAGDISVEGNFIAGDTDGQIGLQTDQNAKTLQAFVITFPTSVIATWTFSALVTKFKAGDFPIDGKLPFSATLTISGEAILAITAATGPTGLAVTGNVTGALGLTPTYDAGVDEYLADGTGDVSATVTVTAAGATTITVNGSSVESGVPSSAITLTAGEVTTITVVVGETGKISLTYVVRVIGPA